VNARIPVAKMAAMMLRFVGMSFLLFMNKLDAMLSPLSLDGRVGVR
jgi:hypothetical protein